MTARFVLNDPLDMHVHFRQKDMLKAVVPHTAHWFSGALVMPNTTPEITTKWLVQDYKREIKEAAGDDAFEPYMTLFLKESYSDAFLGSVKDEILAVKLYPKGITTNSDHGVDPLSPAVERVLKAMEEVGVPLCVHGETKGFVLDREKNFLPIYQDWATKFPKLKIIMEHVTTGRALDLLRWHENVYATITVQHLLCTLDDLAGGMLNPHVFCKPLVKTPHDREDLQWAAVGRHVPEVCSKVMLGTDSAPHAKEKKEAACGCAGCFTAPIALPLLAGLFHKYGVLERLQIFASDNAKRIYGITPPTKKVVLWEYESTIPTQYGEVVPLKAGESMAFSQSNLIESALV